MRSTLRNADASAPPEHKQKHGAKAMPEDREYHQQGKPLRGIIQYTDQDPSEGGGGGFMQVLKGTGI